MLRSLRPSWSTDSHGKFSWEKILKPLRGQMLMKFFIRKVSLKFTFPTLMEKSLKIVLPHFAINFYENSSVNTTLRKPNYLSLKGLKTP